MDGKEYGIGGADKAMNNCPDCMIDENAVGEGARCTEHEIIFLRAALAKFEKERDEWKRGMDKWAEDCKEESDRADAAVEEAIGHLERGGITSIIRGKDLAMGKIAVAEVRRLRRCNKSLELELNKLFHLPLF